MAKPRSSTEEPTQRIPRETLAECAAHHRAQLERAGLVRKAQGIERPELANVTNLRPPRFVRRISPLAALHELGLDVTDVAQMKLDLRAAIARANNDLIHGFRETGRASGFASPRSTRP